MVKRMGYILRTIIFLFGSHTITAATPIWSSYSGNNFNFRSPYSGDTNQPLLLAWSFQANGQFGYPVVGADGTIFVASANYGNDHIAGLRINRTLYAVDPRGNVKWKYNLEPRGTAYYTVPMMTIGNLGIIYIYDNTLKAVNESTGLELWKNDTLFFQPYGIPTISSDGVVYAASQTVSGINYIISVNGTTGKTIWERLISMSSNSAPLIDEENDAIFLIEQYITSRNRRTGNIIWLNSLISGCRGQITTDTYGRIFVICYPSDRILYALNQTTGEILWTYTFGPLSLGNPSVGNGAVYVQGIYASDPTLYAIDSRSGKLLWSYIYTIRYGDQGGTPVSTADGTLYFGSIHRGIIYAINATTGTLKWRFAIDIDSLPTGMAVGIDGTIYVTFNSMLYALRHIPCPIGTY